MFVRSDSDALILAYKTYVLPLLEYCSQVWSPHHATEITRIESVQRIFTKRLNNFKNLSYAERLAKASMCTLELRRLRADLLLCYKILHGFVTINSDICFFELDKTSQTRGHPWKLKLRNARLDCRLHFYTFRTATAWNSLSPTTVCAGSVFNFKLNLAKENLSRFLTIIL